MYRLTKRLAFPSPKLAHDDGLLAVGGDLSDDRLLLAYSLGIFPWYREGDPILWWSPDPRMVLIPSEFRVSKSQQRINRSGRFRVTMDRAFEGVVAACAWVPRPGQDGTWITEEMIAAYCGLHRAGYAHSVECWESEELVGGLYGISLGRCFFGESMFSLESNASKIAMSALTAQAVRWEFTLIDCQTHTPHLERLGAKDVSRSEFLDLLSVGLKGETRMGPWTLDPNLF